MKDKLKNEEDILEFSLINGNIHIINTKKINQ